MSAWHRCCALSKRSPEPERSRTQLNEHPPKIPAPDLGWALSRTLRTPLDGLRISMETMAAQIKSGAFDSNAGVRALEAGIEQVQRIARDVDALIAYAKPRSVSPLKCSLDELLHSTLTAMPAELRARIRITCPKPGSTPRLDGPLLASCLSRLLESSLDAAEESDWILLEVRRRGNFTCFSIFNGGAGSILGPATEREDTPRGAHLGLGESLARRDLERMGATLNHELEGETQHLVVRIPDAGVDQKSSTGAQVA